MQEENASLRAQLEQALAENEQLKAEKTKVEKAFASFKRKAEETIKSLEKTIASLKSDLRVTEAGTKKLRQQGNTGPLERGDSEEETLYNVCNHSSMNRHMDKPEPRLISAQGLKNLILSQVERREDEEPLKVGDTLSLDQIKAAWDKQKGSFPSGDDLDFMFPPNMAIVTLRGDLNDGDKAINPVHLQDFADFDTFGAGKNAAERADNFPYTLPSGNTITKASMLALAAGGSTFKDPYSKNTYSIRDAVPNYAIKEIGETFDEVHNLQRPPKRQETASSITDLEQRRQDRVARGEMSIQGFGTHKTQMCFIVDVPAVVEQKASIPDVVGTACSTVKQAAMIANRLDDDKELQVFSGRIGDAPETIKIQEPGNDRKISAVIQNAETLLSRETASTSWDNKVASLNEHVYGVVEKFFPGAQEQYLTTGRIDNKFRQKPVFCTLVTASLNEEKFKEVEATLKAFSDMKLPFFLKIININPNITDEQKAKFDRLDDKAGKNEIDNMDIVHIGHASELSAKKFLFEYAGFVKECTEEGFLAKKDQGLDLKKVNKRSEGRKALRNGGDTRNATPTSIRSSRRF